MEAVSPRISIPARTQSLHEIRSFCEKVLAGGAGDREAQRKMILAIDEAVANVIEHAYPQSEGNQPTIDVSIELLPDRVVARILDRGRPFDPRAVEALREGERRRSAGRRRGDGASVLGCRPPPRFPQRGFGLHLIRLVVDRIDYQRTSDGENVLILTKNLKKG